MIPKNTDLRHVRTGLSGEEIKLAVLESRRMQQIRDLGDTYLLHPKNAPVRGVYHPTTGARLQ
ncbi:hypothetical protein [Cupriavidus basilensis]|uniref:hypothetical protein n=1 Tax=Cupriavidus basilensis TaxID=68895 RepID=UPI000750BC63|nr:hypothetical protein [Cupriavidus basilensis]